MIVDSHTMVFPADVRDKRADYLARDAGFRELFANASIPVPTAEEIVASMDEAGIDVSVASGFAWNDAELCRMHSEYLLEASAASGGRLVPFCTPFPAEKDARKVLQRYAARGARGLGELRPALQGYSLIDSEQADLLAWAAQAYDLVLLFHVSEPAGPAYPGKAGASLEEVARFLEDFDDVPLIAGGWGGGLPFYALMPAVRASFGGAYVDTASSGLAYDPAVYARVVDLVGAGRILFGSGYPRASQREALEAARSAPLDEASRGLILGENASRLLRLG